MRQQRSVGLIILAVAVMGWQAPYAFAQDPIHKMGRGLGNVLTCWIEIPKNLHLGMQEENPILGVGWGFIKGAGLTLTRLAVGAFESVTFPVPYPQAYASPYEGLELSDYAWE